MGSCGDGCRLRDARLVSRPGGGNSLTGEGDEGSRFPPAGPSVRPRWSCSKRFSDADGVNGQFRTPRHIIELIGR